MIRQLLVVNQKLSQSLYQTIFIQNLNITKLVKSTVKDADTFDRKWKSFFSLNPQKI